MGADITGQLLWMRMIKDWFHATASSSRPYSGSTVVRDEEVSEGVGEEMCTRRNNVEEGGPGTGIGDGFRCGGSSDCVK